jgi:hypothetical protein
MSSRIPNIRWQQATHWNNSTHVKTMFQVRQVIWLFVGLIFGVSRAGALPYVEIIAQIETVIYVSGNTNDASGSVRKKISVACITGTNEWRIDNYMDGGEQKCLFDGTIVYLGMRTLSPEPGKTDRQIEPIKISPFDTGIAKRPGVKVRPSPDGRPWGGVEVAIPWLAFCSGAYLKRENRIIPLPVYPILDGPARYGYSDQTETFDDALGLPRSVELFTSAELYESSVRQWCHDYFLDVSKVKLKSGLKDGLRKFRYVVTESTNYQGWSFPVKFEYVGYEPGLGGVLVPVFMGQGSVTSIRDAMQPQHPTSPGMEHTVEDWRFRDSNKVNAIVYTSTNVSLRPTNDPTLQKIFVKAIAHESSKPTKSQHEARWVILGVIGLSVVPLILILMKRFAK